MILFLGLVAFVVMLAILVLAHELGHFSLAKLMGVRVDEFGLGFPPRLKTWRRNGTLYSLNVIPLGGYVKMLGENGQDDSPDSFGAKPPWQRFLILMAGPSMNILLAVLILWFAYLIGVPEATTRIAQVEGNSPASRAGLRVGDTVLAIDGRRVRSYDQFVSLSSSRLGRRISLELKRGSGIVTIHLTPRVVTAPNQGHIGIGFGESVVGYGPLTSLKLGTGDVASLIGGIPAVLGTIVQHQGQGVSGPIGIARYTTTTVGQEPHQGPGALFLLMALISASVGVLNLLPIPALDGGRLVFVLVSWVRRRNLDPEVEGLIHLAGMAVLLTLIMVISYRDLVQWIGGKPF